MHHLLFCKPLVAPFTPWDPAVLTPLVWVNETSNITEGSTPGYVQHWDNLTVNGVQLGQTALTTRRPLIVASGLDSKRIVEFDGTDDTLFDNGTVIRDGWRNVGYGYHFMLFKRKVSTGGGVSRVMAQSSRGTSAALRLSVLIDSAAAPDCITLQARRLDADAAATLNGTVPVNSGWHMALATMDWTNRTGTIYVDGEVDVQNTTLTSAGNTSNTAADTTGGLAIARSVVGTAEADIQVAEYIADNKPLTTDLVDKLFGSMAHKWGLTSLLDAGHPYKTSPPPA